MRPTSRRITLEFSRIIAILVLGALPLGALPMSVRAGGSDPADTAEARPSPAEPTAPARAETARTPEVTPEVSGGETPTAQTTGDAALAERGSEAGLEAPAPGRAEPPVREEPGLVVGPFSSAGGQIPAGWNPLVFDNIPKHTTYTPELQDGTWVVRAESAGSASGLIRKIEIDLREYPILEWRWKIRNVLQKGDVTKKSGDDYPARIYIAFKYEPERVSFFRRIQYRAGRALFGDIPIGAINYIWASNAKVGQVVDNPFAGDFVKMIVVDAGDAEAGTWKSERRDVLADYRAAFGEDPPPVEGVAIMTDTDNTGETATSWYGDVRFVRASSAE